MKTYKAPSNFKTWTLPISSILFNYVCTPHLSHPSVFIFSCLSRLFPVFCHYNQYCYEYLSHFPSCMCVTVSLEYICRNRTVESQVMWMFKFIILNCFPETYVRVTVNPTSIPSLGTVGLLYFLQLVAEKWLWSNFVFPWLMRLNIFHVYSPLKFPLLWTPGCLFLIFPFFTQSTQIYCTVCASSF